MLSVKIPHNQPFHFEVLDQSRFSGLTKALNEEVLAEATSLTFIAYFSGL